MAIRANGSIATLHLPDFCLLTLERFLELISKGEVTILEAISVELSDLTQMLVVGDIKSEVYIEEKNIYIQYISQTPDSANSSVDIICLPSPESEVLSEDRTETQVDKA